MATREEMKREAIVRMKLMGLRDEAVKAFADNDIVMASVDRKELGEGPLFREVADKVKWFENEFGGLVYHIVFTSWAFATFLYVSKWDEEWEDDKKAIADEGYDVAYAYNMMCPELSELGGIQFKCENGIVIRTA